MTKRDVLLTQEDIREQHVLASYQMVYCHRKIGLGIGNKGSNETVGCICP